MAHHILFVEVVVARDDVATGTLIQKISECSDSHKIKLYINNYNMQKRNVDKWSQLIRIRKANWYERSRFSFTNVL